MPSTISSTRAMVRPPPYRPHSSADSLRLDRRTLLLRATAWMRRRLRSSRGMFRRLAAQRMAERFNAQSGGGQLGLGGLDGHEPRVGSASAADPDLVAGRGAFEVVAEVVPELVAADVDC